MSVRPSDQNPPQSPPPVTDKDLPVSSTAGAGFAGHASVAEKPDVNPLVGTDQLEPSQAPDTRVSEREIVETSSEGLPSLRGESPEALRAKKEAALKKADVALEKLGQLELMERALGVLKHDEGAEAREAGQIIISVTVPPSTEPVNVFPPDKSVDPEKMKELQAKALKALSDFKANPNNAEYNREKLKAEVDGVKVELAQIKDALTEQGQDSDADWEKQFNALENRDFSFNVVDGDGKQEITSISKAKPKPEEHPVADDGKSVTPSSAPSPWVPGQPVPPPPPLPGATAPAAPAKATAVTAHPQGGVKVPQFQLLREAGTLKFTPPYDEAPSGQGNIVSVNAGDKGLYLGGGTINALFGQILEKSSDPQKNGYADYHRDILDLDGDGQGFCVPDLSSKQVIPGVNYSIGLPGEGGGVEGSAFVHVFDDSYCPYGNPENRAMAYIVPPLGNDPKFGSDADFLLAVRNTAKRTMLLVQEYNLRAKAAGNMPPLDVLRMCRFSSGAYARLGDDGKTLDGKIVAAAIHGGLEEACKEIEQKGQAVFVNTVQYEDGSPDKALFSEAGIVDQSAVPLQV
ncbi:hypothetical protein [Parendozoicomonas sp. Alg238-R29]|uniref:hypothetical protein n=1 Tax=Parendozoicomonas sp. Alg238-R29 TaxID=2993446 RepID=UPI00248EB493|nr:hypothetical protein [Parendozoicomonas sp. Alg238-R29]